MIACLLLPDFAAAVERRAEPSLTRTPLILSAAGQVFAASSEAVQAGVRPGLPTSQARSLCPQARFIPAKPDQYQQTLAEILTILRTFAPKLEPEPGPQDVLIYVDFELQTGPVQLALAAEVNRTIRQQIQLPPTLGLAAGKFPAHMAASAIGLNRALYLMPGQERSFLAPLPIHRLPLDQELACRFHLLGLRTIGQLAALPSGAVLAQFGSYGRWLHRLAQGQDDRPIQPTPPKAVEQVTFHFDSPMTDRTRLIALSQSLIQTLSSRLQAKRQIGHRLQLNLHLENGTGWIDQITLRQPTAEPDRLLRMLELVLERAQVNSGVVAVQVSLSDLTPALGEQLPLLEEPIAIMQARWLPEMLTRHGADRFFQSEVIDQTAPLPERRFELRGFVGE